MRDGDDQKKVVSFFSEKIKVTPSVAAPGDTNPSNATAVLTPDGPLPRFF